MTKTTFIRTATKDWTCFKCGKIIKVGSEYKDVETKTYVPNGVNIRHERSCVHCKKNYVYSSPEPVSVDGIKYWFVGIGFKGSTKMLLLKDWNTDKYFWKPECYDWDMHKITVDNVRFI